MRWSRHNLNLVLYCYVYVFSTITLVNPEWHRVKLGCIHIYFRVKLMGECTSILTLVVWLFFVFLKQKYALCRYLQRYLHIFGLCLITSWFVKQWQTEHILRELVMNRTSHPPSSPMLSGLVSRFGRHTISLEDGKVLITWSHETLVLPRTQFS